LEHEALLRLFFSKKKEDILSFYNHIDSYEGLLAFLQNLPKPAIKTYIGNADQPNDIILVIPTPDINNKDVIKIKSYFKNFKIIFSVSSGSYFNFSRSMNTGIKEALRLNPSWIILSNLDIEPAFNTDIMREFLNDSVEDVIVPRIVSKEGREQQLVCNYRFSDSSIIYKLFNLSFLMRFFPVYLRGQFYINKINISKNMPIRFIQINKKLGQDSNIKSYIIDSLFRSRLCYLNVQPFSIIRSYVFKENLFDETFFNGGEDTELSIRLMRNGYSFMYCPKFTIIRDMGKYLGNSEIRLLRNAVLALILLGNRLKESDFLMKPKIRSC